MKKYLLLWAALSISTSAVAADVSGKWIAEITSPSGSKSERIFDFTVSGDKLTGTIVNQSVAEASFEQKGKPLMTGILRTQSGAPQQISEGKISGDEITFSVTGMMMGNKVTTVYTGKVSGNEIRFKVETKFPPGVTPPGPPGAGPPQPQEIVAKKMSK